MALLSHPPRALHWPKSLAKVLEADGPMTQAKKKDSSSRNSTDSTDRPCMPKSELTLVGTNETHETVSVQDPPSTTNRCQPTASTRGVKTLERRIRHQ